MVFRPTILLGLLCAAIDANSPALLRGYRSGHQYIYNFDGQLASSLSNGEDYSTVRVRSEVSLDFLDENTALVQLQRPDLATLNGFLDDPKRIHDIQKFASLDVKPEHVSKLDLPFEIQYDNGKISEIKFNKEDSVWSENIKRSVVNLLQIQLEAVPDLGRADSSGYFYRANETTIEGECENAIHIQKIDNRDSRSRDLDETKSTVNITKTINFEKCIRRPELRYNYYRSSEPIDWNSQSNNNQADQPRKNVIEPVVDAISQYEMSIENEIVQSSKVLSQYSYDMIDKDHASLVTYSVGQLVFKNSEKRSAPENNFSKKPAQSLMHSNEFDLLRERFITQGNEEYLQQNPYLRLDNTAEVVKNILRRLVKSSIEKEGPEGIEEDAARQFSHLVAMLRLASKNDIQQIHEKLFKASEFNEKTQQFVKEILSDALAVAGTKNTLDHLVEKIEKEEISPSKASRTLEKLYNLRLTSEQMVKPIRKLCDSEVVRQNENLKRSCYLAWGAMINAMCGHDHEHEHDHENWAIGASKEKICPSSLKQQYIQDAIQLYKQASDKSDKILALKTLGNMGIDESIEQLEKIIIDKSEDRLVRIHAIDAVRNLRDQVPHKVQRVLTPVFRDRQEHPEIRMNAFQEILQTRPDSALLHMLCSEMAHETNVDVKSFVVSSIKGLVENSDSTLDQKTAQTVKSCLVLLEQMDQDFVRQSASKTHQIGYFSEPSNWHEFGGLATFASIFSNDSFLPKEVMASLDMLMDGRYTPNSVQFGVHMQELEQLTDKLAQNIQSKDFDDIVVRGRRSLTDRYNPVEMLKSLFNKMQLVARRRSATDAEPMFLLYRRHNNMDYSFYLLEQANLPETLKKIIVDGRLDVSNLEASNMVLRTNGARFNYEKQMKLPTTMGIPMIITSRMITVQFIDGKFSLSFGQNEKVRDAKIEIEAHPQTASSVIVKMEIFSPLFTSGVKTIHSVQARLPINLNAEIKAQNLVPTITMKLPEKEIRLVHLQSRPITFIRVWPQKSNVFIDVTEKTLLVPELDRLYKTNDYEHTCAFTGMKFKVASHFYQNPTSDYHWILAGENAFELRIKPEQSSAKTIRLSGERKSIRDTRPTKKLEDIFTKQPALFQNEEESKMLKDKISKSSNKVTDLQKLSLKLEALDGQNDNSINVDFKTASDDRGCLWVVEKDVKVDFGNVWTWKTIGQLAQPELNNVYAPVKSGHVVGKIESSWGSGTTQEKNTVILNVYGKPSELQIEEFKKIAEKKADMADEYEKESILDEKFDTLPAKLRPNAFSVAIEHQVTEATIQTITPYYNWIKSCPKAYIYMPDSSKVDLALSRRHSSLMAHITYDNSLNLTVSTPDERMEMIHWDSESKFSRNPKTIVDLFASSHDDYSKCSYKRNEIVTFDGKTIDIPLTTCYTLLAKDCGSEENSQFAIVAKKLNKNDDDLKVKLLTQKKTVELYAQSGEMVIKVNNIIVTKDEYERYNIRKIESSGMAIYEVKSHHAQLILRFDGQKISIKIADLYMNRQCGICGHMNNDRSDDFLKSDKTQADSVADFHLSYLYRDADECDPEVVKGLEDEKPKSRRRPDLKSSEEEDRDSRAPVKKTITSEKRDEVCFSIDSVYACPKGFENEAIEDPIQKEVKFKCFKRSSPEAQRFLREARERVLEFEDANSDLVEQVTIPTRCVKY